MSKEAMKLALEALEKLMRFESDSWELGSCRVASQAIKALREALANEDLDKMAENARELGLDYEPAQQQEPVAYFVNCTSCGEEKKVDRGNHHPWCFCGSDSFDWGNSRIADTTPQAQPAPTQGWKLVPVKPTKEMVDALADTDPEHESVWDAVLAAAPQPEQQQSCYCPNCESLSKELTELKQRKPLTPEQVKKAMMDAKLHYCGEADLLLTEAIEAAHGIKENT